MSRNEQDSPAGFIPEIRVALTVEDFESAVRFYRDGLGLDPGELWTDGGRGQMFPVGGGSLEVFDTDYAGSVDRLEVGSRVSGPVRLAFLASNIRVTSARAPMPT